MSSDDLLLWAWIGCFSGAMVIVLAVMYRHGYKGRYMPLDHPNMGRRISKSGQRWLLAAAALFTAFVGLYLVWMTDP